MPEGRSSPQGELKWQNRDKWQQGFVKRPWYVEPPHAKMPRPSGAAEPLREREPVPETVAEVAMPSSCPAATTCRPKGWSMPEPRGLPHLLYSTDWFLIAFPPSSCYL